MRINIYYGGRGLIDDPTLFALEKITKVLEELQVTVERYNLYEEKSSITVLPKTLKGADGVILAASLEWFGIGGLLQQFLDACWLYGDKECISQIYMLPVVMATTYGEREAEYSLIRAWEMLGGVPGEGLCAYVDNHVDFETNASYHLLIEKKTENFYRLISKHMASFPNSSMQVKKTVLRSNTLTLTPQESEQLSVYASDDNYVKKQKEDIEELASLFKGMLGDTESDKEQEDRYISELKAHFVPIDDMTAVFRIDFTDMDQTLMIDIHENVIGCYYQTEGLLKKTPDVTAKVSTRVFDSIISGKRTFQNAFMSGELSAQGNFKILRNFDTMFRF